MLSRTNIHARNITRLAQSRPVLQARAVSSTASTQPAGTTLRNVVYGTLLLGGAGLFTVYYLDARAGIHRYVITPALRRIVDAETGHKLAVRVLAAGLAPRDPITDDSLLWAEVSS
jgi:dihydroorotate dehydrogenase